MQANISTVCSASSGSQLTPQVLATNWGINLRTAAQTVKATTQRVICTGLHPMLSRRFRTNERQLRYRYLPIDCFTDSFVLNTISRRSNKCAQIFATADGWCRAFPMSKKSQAHKGLSQLLHSRHNDNAGLSKGAGHGNVSPQMPQVGHLSETKRTIYPMVQCCSGSNNSQA